MPQSQRSDARRRTVEPGFTLIEVLIVIVLLGILVGIVVFAVGNLTTNAKNTGCAAEKTTLSNALETYKSNAGVYPTAAAAGGGAHHALDLLDGAAASVPPFGTPLKSVPADYTIDDAGAGTISLNGANPNGCS